MDPKLHELIYDKPLHVGLLPEIEALLPPDDEGLDALIGETVTENDPRTFNYLLVSALALDRRVDARHLVRGTALMANGRWLSCLAWHMQGEVACHLVEAVRGAVMNPEMHATALVVAAAWSVEFRGGVQPPDLIGEARQLARFGDGKSTYHGLLWALAEMLNDDALRAVLRAKHPRYCSADIIAGAKALGTASVNLCRVAPVALIPAKPSNLISTGPQTRRAVARVGRNELCPCGSGKKYKRCCEEKDKERLRHSSDVAGKTVAEVMTELELHLTEAKIERMLPAPLARLDAAKIRPDLVRPYLRMLAGYLLLDEAATAFEKVGCGDEHKEEAWDFIIGCMCMKQRLDLARRMVKVRYGDGPVPPTQKFALHLLLAREEPARYLEVLEAGARQALTETDGDWLVRFACGLLCSPMAATGIHCARSLIPFIGKRDASYLLTEIERARDRLGLPPEEPAGELLEKRFAEEVAKGGKETEKMRKALARLEAKVRDQNQLEEQLEQSRREARLAEKRAAAATPQQAPVEAAVVRDLREKVRTLTSSHAEGNNERAALRRELGHAYAEIQALREQEPAAAPPPPDAEDALLLSGEVEGNQPPRPIEFPRKFSDTLVHLPRQVGRAALALIGRIAGGDQTAFAGAVRLKATPDVLRVRVGADHRLLFRLLPECVQVVDLINRRDLERTIERLR